MEVHQLKNAHTLCVKINLQGRSLTRKHLLPFSKERQFLRKEFAPLGSKFFPLRVASFEKGFIYQRSKSFSTEVLFVCVEVLRPSQPNEVMSSAVSLPNHTFTGQA